MMPAINWDRVPLILSEDDVAALFNISSATVRRWTKEGVFHPIEGTSRPRRYYKEGIRSHLEENK